ncbi:MAG: response regulator [Myxococcales bacterium]|nr:response regulator [Myxococcales bacterium]
MSSSTLCLVEVASQRVHPLGDRSRIGRGPDADIRLDDPMVALAHAEVVGHDDGTVTIRDLGSRHGTFVGSRRVEQAMLRDGDELLIGPIALRLAVAAPAGDGDELRRLRAVVELTRVIGVEHDIEPLLERVVSTLLTLVRADRGAIVVYDPETRAPRWTVTRNRVAGRLPLTISTSVLSQVMADAQPLLRTELTGDGALERSASLAAQDVRSLMVVPLTYQATTAEWLGVIHLDCQGDGPRFRPADLELLVAVASQAALAIKNALLVAQIQTVRDAQWRRLERVVHDLPVGVVVLDDLYRCVLANPWVTARAELLGEVRTGQVVSQLAGVATPRLIGPDGPRALVAGAPPRSLAVTTANAGDGSETVIVIADVTQQREHEARAAHQDRLALLGQLAGGVAHDFNNLLVVILNYAGFLEADLPDSSMKDDAQQIVHAANRASDLTRQLLAFSRRDAAKPTVVEMGPLIARFGRLLGRNLGAHVELETAVAEDLPPVLIDPGQLEQVLMNLVVNARDAMPTGGRVTLTVAPVASGPGPDRAGQPHVVLEVADTGAGIPAEVLPRVFEPYFTTKDHGKGTGLGLATVHGIVQQAGGEITVESPPGRGAIFRVYLPATTAPMREDLVARPVPATSAATVLVVDDDDRVRLLTERILVRAGYRVLVAASGPAALAAARDHVGEIDLLLSDMVMPGMSGSELAQAMTATRPRIKVLFMSGYDRGQTGPSQRLITKPFNRDGLIAAVVEALSGAPGRPSRIARLTPY